MIKLALFGAVALLLLVAFILIVRNKPDLWFWIFLNLFFDPGGYLYGFFGLTLIGPLHITDVCLGGICLSVIFANFDWKEIFQDKLMLKFQMFLLIYSAYFFIVYGGIMPYLNNDFNYATFFIKNRVFLYGIFLFLATYAFSYRSLYYFYSTTLFIGSICLTLFFVSLITGISLIPVETSARYGDENMVRISMLGYGIFYFLFPLALTTYLLSKKINLNLKYKAILYYSGIIMLFTLLITLTRRVQIEIISTILIIIMLISSLFRTSKIYEILKILLPSIIIILLLSFSFPKYLDYILTIGEDTFLLITTGKDSRGESDERVSSSGDLNLTKKYISENLFFGTGYTYLHWGRGFATSNRGDTFARAADAAGEVPIYYLLFGYGIIGALLMVPLYYFMIAMIFPLFKLLKLTLLNLLREPLFILFTLYILLFLISKFTYRLYALSLDFTGANLAVTGVFMGVGYSLHRKLLFSSINSEKKLTPDNSNQSDK